jgi:hypothetical protein
MLEAELIVVGVWQPDTLASVPYTELDADGDGRQNPADEGEFSATVDEGKNPGVCH